MTAISWENIIDSISLTVIYTVIMLFFFLFAPFLPFFLTFFDVLDDQNEGFCS